LLKDKVYKIMTIYTDNNQDHFYVAVYIIKAYFHIDSSNYSSKDDFDFYPHRKTSSYEFDIKGPEALHAATLKPKRQITWK